MAEPNFQIPQREILLSGHDGLISTGTSNEPATSTPLLVCRSLATERCWKRGLPSPQVSAFGIKSADKAVRAFVVALHPRERGWT
jgi:hypothetical protein